MTILSCDAVAELGLVERYVTKRLTQQEREEFEAHFLTCERCQSALVLGAGIRASLPQVRTVARGRSWLVWGGGLGLAAAAGLAVVMLRTAGPRAPLARLGELVQAPIYLGIPVRGGQPRAADSLFEAAMTAYTAERFDQASSQLRAAIAAGVDSAPAEFFLGASYLMTGRPKEASASFASVVALGDTPYLAEAHFYRAKALLRLGETRAALDELKQAGALGGVIGGYARALTDSIERVSRR